MMGDKFNPAPGAVNYMGASETIKRETAPPDAPIEMVSALAEGVEYVDASALIAALLGHTKRLHEFTNTLGNSLVDTQQSLIRAHKKLVELEADMAAAGIGSKAEKSALILPDRMTKN